MEKFVTKLSNGWNVGPEYSVSNQAEEVKQIVKELLALPREKRPVSNIQAPSTQATLDRDPALDEAHWNRKNPDELEWKREVVERVVTAKEVLIEEEIRRKGRNTLGASTMGSVDPVKKSKGIEAFVYSNPANLTEEQKKKLTRLEEIASSLFEPEKKKPGSGFREWFQGKFFKSGVKFHD